MKIRMPTENKATSFYQEEAQKKNKENPTFFKTRETLSQSIIVSIKKIPIGVHCFYNFPKGSSCRRSPVALKGTYVKQVPRLPGLGRLSQASAASEVDGRGQEAAAEDWQRAPFFLGFSAPCRLGVCRR